MTARELLEAAAKAAGYTQLGTLFKLGPDGQGTTELECLHLQDIGKWNPIDDDGDGARLEAALGLDVLWHDADGRVTVRHAEHGFHAAQRYDWHSGDKQAARRMATLRCAAAIGRAMMAGAPQQEGV